MQSFIRLEQTPCHDVDIKLSFKKHELCSCITYAQYTVVEQVKKNNITYRKEREDLQLTRFTTLYQGLKEKF